ncbi:FecR family protein [Echinicola sp. 20G]|uniref:FecR family protein n=1 Tax=Echinicola sp. 20G TaxID=2781961 RepID=UPI001910737E|nr:FecR family protein [Echinicola sp. 20G]
MKTFSNIEDFLDNPPFKEWVRNGASEGAEFYVKFIDENPDKVELLDKARQIFEGLQTTSIDWTKSNEDDLFDNIKQEINKDNSTLVNRKRKNWSTKIVASVFFGLIVLLAWNNGLFEGFSDQTQVQVADTWTVKVTPSGQKNKIYLPDGTVAFMNSESTIKYDEGFGRRHRNLLLIGEAYFEVTKNKHLPFKVASGEIVTEALGTAFNVNAYNQNSIKVQLTEGKVKVYQEDLESNDMVLAPGEMICFSENKKMKKGNFDLEGSIPWVEGVLLFDKKKFSEIKEELERWFGVKINLKNLPKEDYEFSGKYKKATLKEILESMEHAMQFEYIIENKNVTISFN